MPAPGDSALAGPSVLDTSPHLGNYIFKLVLSNAPRAASGQHPLSVSSSGGSDDSDEADDDDDKQHARSESGTSSTDEDGQLKAPNGRRNASGPSREDREELVRKVISLLDNEQEEDVKDLLREPMGELGKDDLFMDQICLDIMHRHRDDLSGVPYQAGSFTPTRVRRTGAYTPTGVGTLRVRTPLGRPHSPLPGSGAQTPTSAGPGAGLPPSALALGRVDSAPSPTFGSGMAPGGPPSAGTSPVSSPRPVFNVKAASFNPSGSGGAGGVTQLKTSPLASSSSTTPFSPSDPWRDADPNPPPPRSPAYFGAAQGMVRTGSNRAIAAPLISDPSSPFHSPLGTPTRPQLKLGSDFASPTGPRPSSRGVVPPDDDDEDEFSPFGTTIPKLHHPEPSGLNTFAKPFEPFASGGHNDYSGQVPPSDQDSQADDDGSNATAGMTPLDVLASVFSTVPRVQLEDALHRSGYDFEAAMAMLVAQFTHPRSGASTPQRVASPRPMIGVDGRGVNHHAPGPGYFQQGGRGLTGGMSPGFGARGNVGPTRMCRYFLNGECRRSDCRFSHDLDRALCRFWLRGHCAKGPNCEFLHQLPNNMDPHQLNSAMGRLDMDSPRHSRPGTPPVQGMYGAGDDFPDLLAARLNRHVGRFDPSRNRFANAVKRPVPAPIHTINATGGPGGRFSPAPGSGPYSPAGERPGPPQSVPAVPRPSQRLKLHPPTLLPTLNTGTGTNEQYMAARATSIRLGHARNACLARAADAFRRGDGAAAKRFSREGKALNEKMLHEANEAANVLVRERMREAQRAARERDPSWSDDPRDRAERGRECGAGLGVVLGVASAGKVPGGDRLSAEERTEALLDLHTLHGAEGADVVGHFLAELERESYRGLAYLVVGEEKHVGQQDTLRGASKTRLGASVKQILADWGYAWNENAGVLCVDPCR